MGARMALLMAAALMVAACGRMDHLGRPPSFTPDDRGQDVYAMQSPSLPGRPGPRTPGTHASLWAAGQRSLLGDRRAEKRGDILTVVIDINDSATISDSSQRSRSGSESMRLGQLFGLPQNGSKNLPSGATLDPGVDLGSSSTSQGAGSIKRNEKLTLRIAATVTRVLPNGILEIAGVQEVRVNFELRELQITGYVRPDDISRRNEITYDKIAQARISYGGRGHITDMQQPRYGQQIADMVLPF